MDYIDKVYKDLKDRPPGKFLMSSLKSPENFTLAVKYLIDGAWLANVHWDSDYTTFFIEEKFPFQSDKKEPTTFLKPTWYDNQKIANDHDHPDAESGSP